MTENKTTARKLYLDRPIRLLQIGEAIKKLNDKCYRGSFAKNVKESSEELRVKIEKLGGELQKAIPKEKAMSAINNILGWGEKEPPIEDVWIIALSAYHMALPTHNDSPDEIAKTAGILFSEDRITGAMLARQVLGDLFQRGILEIRSNKVLVCCEIRHWLAGGNRYACFCMSGEELQHLRAKQDTIKKSLGKSNPPSKKSLGKSKPSTIQRKVEKIPLLKPQEIYEELGRQGYVGQESARKTVCLGAYRHVLRLRMLYLDGIAKDKLPPRNNILLTGQTGTGKTFLINSLFEQMLRLPTTVADATAITEAGYIGEDVSIILARLMQTAEADGGDLEWAQCGISAIDEIDKISAQGVNDAVFDGAGSRNDVSRGGAQRGLLKIMEEDAVVEIPEHIGRSINQSKRISFNAGNVLFVGMGAFTGIESFSANKAKLGFGGDEPAEKQPNLVAQLCSYGLQRELVGRFGTVAQFEPLSVEDLSEILDRNVVTRFVSELGINGIDLDVTDEVKQLIIAKALDRNTGARAITSELQAILNDACFDAYSSPRAKKISLYCENDIVRWDIAYAHSSAKIGIQRQEKMA